MIIEGDNRGGKVNQKTNIIKIKDYYLYHQKKKSKAL